MDAYARPRKARPGPPPVLGPEQLGAPGFTARFGARLPWVVGGMALGIGSLALVGAAAAHGCLAFHGAAGVALDELDAALRALAQMPGPVGVNLAHHPDAQRDDAVVDLVLAHGIERLEASAFLRPTPAVVRYRHRDRGGRSPRLLVAKCSRIEVAARWMAPAPERLVASMVARGELSESEANDARRLPLADAVTVEADSGGHTDARALLTTLPAIVALAKQVRASTGVPVLVGAAGGLATPAALAAALMLGADYLLGGSIHQACVESGASPRVRHALAGLSSTDVIQIAAVDLLHTGARVQVVNNRFARTANRIERLLYRHPDLWQAPVDDRRWVEQLALGTSLDHAWDHAARWLAVHEAQTLARALDDGSLRSLMVLRAWLAAAARAVLDPSADPDDCQIWCGPAMGAFNAWTAGTPLADPEARRFTRVVDTLLHATCEHLQAHCPGRLGVQAVETPARGVS